MEKKWKTVKSEYVLDTRWLKVRKDAVILPNNCLMDDYYITEKKDVVLIAALDGSGNILLKEEYRYPINEDLIELPGGTIDNANEEPLDAAKREFLEETGYCSNEWRLLSTNFDYPTKDTNRVYIFLAKNIFQKAEQHLDISEDITYSFYSLEEAVNMCLNNKIKVNGSMAAILLINELLK